MSYRNLVSPLIRICYERRMSRLQCSVVVFLYLGCASDSRDEVPLPTAQASLDVPIPITDANANAPDSQPDFGCSPSKTCADYPGQCGTEMDDGCVGVIDCRNNCLAPEICLQGMCEEPQVCEADCAGKDCGSDGCGGLCGTCEEGEACESGLCVADCVSNCEGLSCGDDGCGGLCGTCDEGEACESGLCVLGCEANCEGLSCGDDGCGESCGECPSGESCVDGLCVGCEPACGEASCGDDGCGGTCGDCPCAAWQCEAGQCMVPALPEGAALTLNEILADPHNDVKKGDANCDGVRDAEEDEFVELVNTGSVSLDLCGVSIEDDKETRHTFLGDWVLQPGEVVVVFGGGTPTFDASESPAWCGVLPPNVSVVLASSGSLELNNPGDEVRVVAPDQSLLDSYKYGGPGNEKGDKDQSLVRIPELTGSLAPHNSAPSAIGAQSPGIRANGEPL